MIRYCFVFLFFSKSVFASRWARGICELGRASSSDTSAFASVGLTGKDQIVGIVDSGLDMASYYFHDDKYPTPLDQTNLLHRKVLMLMLMLMLMIDDLPCSVLKIMPFLAATACDYQINLFTTDCRL